MQAAGEPYKYNLLDITRAYSEQLKNSTFLVGHDCEEEVLF
jgi:hypothetical protein